METKSVPGTTLNRISEQNEYKVAFIEVMSVIEGSILSGSFSPETKGLWKKTKAEHKDRLSSCFATFLRNFEDDERELMKETIREWLNDQ